MLKTILAATCLLTVVWPLHAEEQRTFVNPVYAGQDPYLARTVDGTYLSALEPSVGGHSIHVCKSASMMDRGVSREVYRAPRTGRFTSELWAPEIHFVGGHWYIYTCADDGNNANHRAIVLKADGEYPQGSYSFAAELMTPGWAIDAHVFRGPKDKLYCLWSGWPEGVPPDSTQHIFISAMKSPTELVGPAVDISGSMSPWECVERPAGLNEGPQILEHNGQWHIVYSASGSWTADYCLGLLTLAGDDFLDAAAWHKHAEPVFKRTGNVYGPGHCCVTKSPDGSEDWLVYHSSIDEGGSWNRAISITPFDWTAANVPDFGTPPAWGEALRMPSGEPPLASPTLFEETFENLDRWQVLGFYRGNSIRSRRGKLDIRAHLDPRFGDKALVRGIGYGDVAVDVDIRINAGSGGGGVILRAHDAAIGRNRFKGYVVHVTQSGDVELQKSDGEELATLAKGTFPIGVGQWHKLKVVAQGPQLTVTIDDAPTPAVTVNDATYSNGQIGLRSLDANVSFDNFVAKPLD